MNKKTFQLVSDLHLEYYKKINYNEFIIPSAKNLIIAGDIGYFYLDNYKPFIEQCSNLFEHVFLVLGNHDYYTVKTNIMSMNQIEENIKLILKDYDNIHLLQNETYDFEDYTIIGTTLWSNIPFNMHNYIKNAINDYNYIFNDLKKQITVNELNYLHYKNVKWLESQINNTHKKILIITHHLPSYQLIHKKYENSPLNYAFATNLEYLLKSNVTHVCCGHSHSNVNIKINNCQLLINPKGYPNENELYNKQFIFNLE